MRLRDLLADVQAQPGARDGSVTSEPRAVEAVEDVRLVLRRDPLATVLDADPHVAAAP